MTYFSVESGRAKQGGVDQQPNIRAGRKISSMPKWDVELFQRECSEPILFDFLHVTDGPFPPP